MTDNRNLWLAIALSLAVMLGWELFVAQPEKAKEQQRQAELAKQEKKQPALAANAPAVVPPSAPVLSRGEALARAGKRVAIETPTVDGSFTLKGARFDDLRLKCYHEHAGASERCGSKDPKNPEIVLFAPNSTKYPYYADIGWLGAGGAKVPDENSVWSLKSGTTLSPGHPVALEWNNGAGLIFTRTIAIDDKYMFTISDSVKNAGGKAATLYPYAAVTRKGREAGTHFWALHEGFVGVMAGSAKYDTYDDMKIEDPPKTYQSTGGWLGITDKYWMAAVIPDQKQPFDGEYRVSGSDAAKNFQADYRLAPRTLAPGTSTAAEHRLFAGAKVVSILRDYENRQGVEQFDYAIDWGWFFFLTKPMFLGLDWLYKLAGNFGIAILLLTVVIKLAFFPLADASYRSMGKMKKLQPEMEKIKERFADDKVKQQQEIMELYKREKLNPVGGCLPMLLQIPVFFSLYKVVLVTIEMRHAPFFGWIQDLSAADPTSIINLFGLLPYAVPAFITTHAAFLSIGIWPVLMGFSQWLTMKLNPAPADPIQAKMFAYMPVIFTFMMATFPSGLIIYWTWNNLLTGVQQYTVMKRQGADIHLFENLKLDRFFGGKKKKDEPAK